MNNRSTSLPLRLERLQEAARTQFVSLQTAITIDGRTLRLHNAGIKGGRVRFGLFGRDLLITAMMLQDTEAMAAAIRFVCRTLGRRFDPRTGEEPGRGMHEYTDVNMRGRLTRYNAAEVSLLLLITAADYWRLSADESLLREERPHLIAAINYARRHLEDGLFIEDPRNCGADGYALRATYWKDSRLPDREDPAYPICYTLVQAQAIAALRAAAILASPLSILDQQEDLCALAETAVSHLFTDLWDEKIDYPLIARDRKGGIPGISSDALHMLAYLHPEDVPQRQLALIYAGSEQLETQYGFRTYGLGQPDCSPRDYHLGAIWPFEQAFIAYGSIVHSLPKALTVALRTINALEQLGFVELYYFQQDTGLMSGGTQEAEGCDVQLWSLATPAALMRLLNNGP